MGKVLRRVLTREEIKEKSIRGSLCDGCPKNLAVTGVRQVQCSAQQGMHVFVSWSECEFKMRGGPLGQVAA